MFGLMTFFMFGRLMVICPQMPKTPNAIAADKNVIFKNACLIISPLWFVNAFSETLSSSNAKAIQKRTFGGNADAPVRNAPERMRNLFRAPHSLRTRASAFLVCLNQTAKL